MTYSLYLYARAHGSSPWGKINCVHEDTENEVLDSSKVQHLIYTLLYRLY